MNNMNNFGMNPMFMNPILMNNMNNIPINNQPNFMDNAALIQNYENKIRELEEIIKQKDFEIIVLKQKLNNIPNNNLMNMNMNLMNPMMNIMNQNMNMNIQPMIDPFNRNSINIHIQSDISNEFKCFTDDKASILKNRLRIMHNYKLIDIDKTIEENGIFDGSIIKVTDKFYTLHFKDESNQVKNIMLDGDCPVKQAIKFYSLNCKDENIYQMVLNNKIYFIFDSIKLNVLDETPIKKIFFSSYIPIIKVFEYGRVIG